MSRRPRDAGRAFYPLADGLARHLCDDPARTLAALHEELLDHVGGRLHDDAALLLVRKPVAAARAVPAVAGPDDASVPAASPVVTPLPDPPERSGGDALDDREGAA
ncbi:hypothetical protein RKD26_006514 [Streptomyces calvus]